MSIKALIIEGPRGSGKTTATRRMCSTLSGCYPIKFHRGSLNYHAEDSQSEFPIRMEYLARFIDQLPLNGYVGVFDRHVGTEWVMAKVHGREIDEDAFWEIDRLWANIAVQAFLYVTPDVRAKWTEGRDDQRKTEGNVKKVDAYWSEYLERTAIKTVVVNGEQTEGAVVADIIRGVSSEFILPMIKAETMREMMVNPFAYSGANIEKMNKMTAGFSTTSKTIAVNGLSPSSKVIHALDENGKFLCSQAKGKKQIIVKTDDVALLSNIDCARCTDIILRSFESEYILPK